MKEYIFKCDLCLQEARQRQNRTPSGWRELTPGNPPPVMAVVLDICPNCAEGIEDKRPHPEPSR